MGGEPGELERIAARLGRRAGRTYPIIAARAPAGLWFLTDPARTADPASVIARLPKGAVAIYRGFGAPDALLHARRLAWIARRRGVRLLIGADPDLARRSGAGGVHLPERLAHLAGRLTRAHPGWLVSVAAHSLPAARRAARLGAQAVLVSAVFSSRSPSAGAPLGPLRFEALARRTPAPVIALGGVNARTATRLAHGRASGLAAIEGLIEQQNSARRGKP